MSQEKIDEIFKNIITDFIRENINENIDIILLENELNKELNNNNLTQRKRVKI